MTETKDKPLDLGVYAAKSPEPRPVTEIMAGLLSVVWVIGVGL